MNRADRRRMERFLGRLMTVYLANEYPFSKVGVEPPQRLVPEEIKANKATYAFFLFVLCLWMRGGIESDTATKSLVALYDHDPRLFDPHWVKDYDPRELESHLKENGLGFAAAINADLWVGNARLLVERWQGDPRMIFHDFGRYSDKKKWSVAVARIKNQGKRGRKGGFGGFREKMTSMLIYYLMEEDLIPNFNFPVPVDFHVSRMMVMHRVFKLDPKVSYTGGPLDQLLDDIRHELFRYSKRHGISAIELCNALWLFSRSMCSESPAFRAQPGERNGRSTVIPPFESGWTWAETVAYQRTCGQCPVHDTCDLVVRSAHWYIQGRIHTEPKSAPPQLSLFDPKESHGMTTKVGEGGPE